MNFQFINAALKYEIQTQKSYIYLATTNVCNAILYINIVDIEKSIAVLFIIYYISGYIEFKIY